MQSRRAKSLALAALAALLTWPALGQGAPYPPADQDRPPIVLKHHGIFWAGGQIVQRTQPGIEPSGTFFVPIAGWDIMVGQAYVEYYIPENLRDGDKTIPIVLIPGGGLIGVHYLTTPDGREGWADFFIRRGFPVYIVDPPGRARAGFTVDPYNTVKALAAPPTSQPNLGHSDASQWLEWNAGPSPRVPGPHDPACIGNDNLPWPGGPAVYCNGDLMPARDLEGYKHWLGALVPSGPTPAGTNPGFIAVLQKVGPAIYVGHSAGGTSGAVIANSHPDLFKALIGIEPSVNCLRDNTNLPINGLFKVPALSIHGINQVGRGPEPGSNTTAQCLAYYSEINSRGGDATYLSLPDLPDSVLATIGVSSIPQAGIWGNDHIMMWDTNSDQIAEIMLDWIEQHVEHRRGGEAEGH